SRDWSSDVCSSDLTTAGAQRTAHGTPLVGGLTTGFFGRCAECKGYARDDARARQRHLPPIRAKPTLRELPVPITRGVTPCSAPALLPSRCPSPRSPCRLPPTAPCRKHLRAPRATARTSVLSSGALRSSMGPARRPGDLLTSSSSGTGSRRSVASERQDFPSATSAARRVRRARTTPMACTPCPDR